MYNKMIFINLNDTSSPYFLIVSFLKISFTHLKQIFSTQKFPEKIELYKNEPTHIIFVETFFRYLNNVSSSYS